MASMSAVPVLLPAGRRRPLRADADPGACCSSSRTRSSTSSTRYEAIRTRWDPRRLRADAADRIAAFIWIFIKLPQEWWIHVAQLDATDLIKTKILASTQAPWTDAIAAGLGPRRRRAAVVALVLLARWCRPLACRRPTTRSRSMPTPPADGRRGRHRPRAAEHRGARRRARAPREARADRLVTSSSAGCCRAPTRLAIDVLVGVGGAGRRRHAAQPPARPAWRPTARRGPPVRGHAGDQCRDRRWWGVHDRDPCAASRSSTRSCSCC